MNLLNVDTIGETRARLMEHCQWISPKTETADLIHAVGRILALDLSSSENIPPYRRSTVDGYAVRSSDIGAASDITASDRVTVNGRSAVRRNIF